MEFNEIVTQLEPYVGHALMGGFALIVGLLGGFLLAARSYRKFLLNGIKFATDSFLITNEMVGIIKDGNSACIGTLSNYKNIDANSFAVTINGIRYNDTKFSVTKTGEVWWDTGNFPALESGYAVTLDYRHGKLVPLIDVLNRQEPAQPESDEPSYKQIAARLCSAEGRSIYFRGRAFFRLIAMTDLAEGDVFVILDENKGHIGEVLTAKGNPFLRDDLLTIEAEPKGAHGGQRPCVACGKPSQLKKSAFADMSVWLCDCCFGSQLGEREAQLISVSEASPEKEDYQESVIGDLEDLGVSQKNMVDLIRRTDKHCPVYAGGQRKNNPAQIPSHPTQMRRKYHERRSEGVSKLTPRQQVVADAEPGDIKYRFWGVTEKGQIVADASSETRIGPWAKSRNIFTQLGLMGERPIPEDVLKRFKMAPGTLSNNEWKDCTTLDTNLDAINAKLDLDADDLDDC